MGAFQRIQRLLEPLRLYSFKEGSISEAELTAASDAIDDFASQLDGMFRELSPYTAGEDGVSQLEDLLDLHPPGNLDTRRQAVINLMEAEGSASIEGLRKMLAASGIEVGVREATAEADVIEVFFPGTPGIPDNFNRIQKILDRLLPCHLEARYVYNYITWTIFEKRFRRWNDLDASGLSWNEIELIIEV